MRDNLRDRRSIERSYITGILAARHEVDIVSAYFYPGRALRRALRGAARRGVRVRLLLQGKVDYRIAGLAARVLYGELLADVEIVFAHLDNTRSNQIFGPKNFVFTRQMLGILDMARAQERSRVAAESPPALTTAPIPNGQTHDGVRTADPERPAVPPAS